MDREERKKRNRQQYPQTAHFIDAMNAPQQVTIQGQKNREQVLNFEKGFNMKVESIEQ